MFFFRSDNFPGFPGLSVRQTDMFFFSRGGGGSICFFRTDRYFQGGLSSRHVFSRRVYLFVKQTSQSHRTDTHFSGNPYLVLITINYAQTHTNFPGASIFSSNKIFIFQLKPYLVLFSTLQPLCLEHR